MLKIVKENEELERENDYYRRSNQQFWEMENENEGQVNELTEVTNVRAQAIVQIDTQMGTMKK